MKSKFTIAKFVLRKIDTSFYATVQTYLDILSSLGVTHECDRQTNGQTDGQTDTPLANAALNYVVRSKNTTMYIKVTEMDIRGVDVSYFGPPLILVHPVAYINDCVFADPKQGKWRFNGACSFHDITANLAHVISLAVALLWPR